MQTTERKRKQNPLIEKYSVEGIWGTTLNFPIIAKLPEEEFAKLYLALMEEYRDNYGWWSKGKIPKCGQCHEVIEGPKDLRRYYGNSVHGNCLHAWRNQRAIRGGKKYKDTDEIFMKSYWGRLETLDLTRLVESTL